ncbi:MAG TPA: hypothetical protein VF105_07960 [Gemmatimonadaceae bacterium]
MNRLASWSGRRITLACVGWLLGSPTLAAIGLLIGGLVLGLFSGSLNVSFKLNLTGWSLGTWLFLPPIALVAAWLWARRQSARISAS